MTNEKQIFDELKCGNCGYDGGKAVLQEKLKWQEELYTIQTKLTKVEQVSNETRQHRVWALGLTFAFCTAIMSYASYAAFEVVYQKTTPVNPVVNAQEALKEMYNQCVRQAHIRDDLISPGIIDCNRTFGSQIQRLELTDEKKETD